MCGRATLVTSTEEIAELFGVEPTLPAGPPKYNIAPTEDLVGIHLGKAGGKELTIYRWGLIPWFATDKKIANKCINARVETLETAPAFRDAFKTRRCLVIVDGFFEWKKPNKIPHHIRLPDGKPFALAGVWDRWTSPEGQVLQTCSIVTTTAHGPIVQLHDRMPLVLAGADRDRWLGTAADAHEVLSHARATQPERADELVLVAVSKRVNNVHNKDAACLDPPTPDETSATPAAPPKQRTLFD